METPEAFGNWHNKGYGATLDHFRSLSWGKFSLDLIEDVQRENNHSSEHLTHEMGKKLFR